MGKGTVSFCDFCECVACREGAPDLEHAPTDDGRWICDVCFDYDQCTTGPNRANHPCDEAECEHRPRLSGDWVAL
jgi:hypothetical protein